jgi:hypothetical protein
MSREIELVPVRRDAAGNVREWKVERPPVPVERTEIAAPGAMPPAQPVRATSHVSGSYLDRARSFSLMTWQLSTVAGVGTLVLGNLAWGVPLLSLAALAYLIGGYFVAWLVAYLFHVLISAEGAEFYATAQMWRYLREEQKEQHRRYWHSIKEK